jgi:hypothetical protein
MTGDATDAISGDWCQPTRPPVLCTTLKGIEYGPAGKAQRCNHHRRIVGCMHPELGEFIQ